MAVVYDRRLLFTLKLAKNMGEITDDLARTEALSQYPPEVQADVERIVRLKKIARPKRSTDDGSS